MSQDTAKTLEYLPVVDLIPNSRNAKGHDIGLIHTSIARFGFIETIVRDDRTGMIVSGHGRAESLLQMQNAGQSPPDGIRIDEDGKWLAPVLTGWASHSDIEANAATIALNRSTELGGWVDDQLLDLLEELAREEGGLDGVGFDADDIEDLRNRLAGGVPEDMSQVDEDEVEPAPTVISQLGDVWVIGPHRLICGDSTEEQTLANLLGTERADTIWTDPPYGVSYIGKTKDALRVHNDGVAGLRALLSAAFPLMRDYSVPGAPFYVAAPPGPQLMTFGQALVSAGLPFKQILVWVKSVMVMGHSDYHYRHEFVIYGQTPNDDYHPEHEVVFYGHTPGDEAGGYGRGRAHWYGGNDKVTVFMAEKPGRNAEHPTMKPIALVQAQLANSLPRNGLVLDPFGGSGTTMLATHSLGGRCRMVEYGPEYVDVIVRRMAAHTTLPMALIRDGQEVPGALEQVRAAVES